MANLIFFYDENIWKHVNSSVADGLRRVWKVYSESVWADPNYIGIQQESSNKAIVFLETELALANFSTCKAGQIQKVSWFSAQLLKLLKSDVCSIFGGKI